MIREEVGIKRHILRDHMINLQEEGLIFRRDAMGLGGRASCKAHRAGFGKISKQYQKFTRHLLEELRNIDRNS